MSYNAWKPLGVRFVVLTLVAAMLLAALPVGATDVSQGVTIVGPERGVVNETYPYQAMLLPVGIATSELEYEWETDGDGVIVEREESTAVGIRWETVGTKTITVTATVSGTNGLSTLPLTDTHTVVIGEGDDDGELREVAIRGPEFGLVNESYPYRAIVFPQDFTGVVSYTWVAEGGIISPTNNISSEVLIRWETPGPKIVQVLAQSGDVTVMARRSVAIRAAPDDDELREVVIRGPELGLVRVIYAFQAVVFPEGLGDDVQYVWSTDDDGVITAPAEPNTDGPGTDSFSTVGIHWETPGTKTVTVTASLSTTTVTDTHTVVIRDGRARTSWKQCLFAAPRLAA